MKAKIDYEKLAKMKGCEGCTKDCPWNSNFVTTKKANAYRLDGLYNCNSKKVGGVEC